MVYEDDYEAARREGATGGLHSEDLKSWVVFSPDLLEIFVSDSRIMM